FQSSLISTSPQPTWRPQAARLTFPKSRRRRNILSFAVPEPIAMVREIERGSQRASQCNRKIDQDEAQGGMRPLAVREPEQHQVDGDVECVCDDIGSTHRFILQMPHA